jgi:Na+-translocating ferredoxin:NAD+ oxidoreductase RnfG subunit
MKKRYSSIALLILVATSSVANYSYLPDYLTKKMSRQLTKIFGKEMKYQEVAIGDSLAINHQIFEVKTNDNLSGYSMITRALGCQTGGCDKPNKDTISFEEFFFLTAFDKQKNIKKVRVLEYTSDHGYQIANKGWLKQFERDSPFEVGRNIDGISGATISVKSITKAVNEQIGILESRF